MEIAKESEQEQRIAGRNTVQEEQLAYLPHRCRVKGMAGRRVRDGMSRGSG